MPAPGVLHVFLPYQNWLRMPPEHTQSDVGLRLRAAQPVALCMVLVLGPHLDAPRMDGPTHRLHTGAAIFWHLGSMRVMGAVEETRRTRSGCMRAECCAVVAAASLLLMKRNAWALHATRILAILLLAFLPPPNLVWNGWNMLPRTGLSTDGAQHDSAQLYTLDDPCSSRIQPPAPSH